MDDISQKIYYGALRNGHNSATAEMFVMLELQARLTLARVEKLEQELANLRDAAKVVQDAPR